MRLYLCRGAFPHNQRENVMLDITYYYVEQLVRPETGWQRVKPCNAECYKDGGLQDKAEAEKLLQKKKAHWEEFLANAEQTDDVKRLQAVADWRIVEEVVTFTHASFYMYSDVKAYEIVKVISDKTLEVRAMNVSHSCRNLKFSAGGFLGHYHDQHNQEVKYESDPDGEVVRIRRKKGSFEKWGYKSCRFGLTTEPYAFHDFNF